MNRQRLHNKLGAEATHVGLSFLGEGKNRYYHLYQCNQCGQKLQIQTTRVRHRQFECKRCLELVRESEAIAVGLILVGRGNKAGYRLYRFHSCGHEQLLQIGHVRNDSFDCKACLHNEQKSEAERKGLTLIGRSDKAGYNNYRFNKCGHIQLIAHGDVAKEKGFRCHQCQDDKLRYEAKRAGLILIGDGEDNTSREYEYMECGHTQDIKTGSVRKMKGFRCKQCQDEKLNREANNAGLTLLGDGPNSQYRRYIIDACGHQQNISTGNVRTHTFTCNTCEETARDQPSNLYLIKIVVGQNEWLKLGYSKSVSERAKRFGLPSNAKTECLYVVQFETGRECHQAESAIHKKYKPNKLSAIQMRTFHTKSGFEECYPTNLLDNLLGEISRKNTDLYCETV